MQAYARAEKNRKTDAEIEIQVHLNVLIIKQIKGTHFKINP